MPTTVRDIYRAEYPSIQRDASIREAAARMKECHSRCLIVTNRESAIGLVSDWDILEKSVIRGLDQNQTPVESIMRVGFPYCSTGVSIEDAAEMMLQKRLGQLAVVNSDSKPVVIGVLKVEDVVRSLLPEALNSDFLLAVVGPYSRY